MTRINPARRAACLFAAVAAFALAGCGPSTGTIEGKVTLNGQPVTDLTVNFVSANGDIVSATVGPDGAYTATGILTGDTKVTVTPMSDTSMDAQQAIKKGKAEPGAPKVKINPKYLDSNTSGLALTVKSGKNPFDIPLTN